MTMAETKELVAKVLDAYFQFRSNVPEFGGSKLLEDKKTTQDIIDDLAPMMTVSETDVLNYLHDKGYQITSMEDGSVKWQIWRIWDGAF